MWSALTKHTEEVVVRVFHYVKDISHISFKFGPYILSRMLYFTMYIQKRCKRAVHALTMRLQHFLIVSKGKTPVPQACRVRAVYILLHLYNYVNKCNILT